jgi:hypothetical protein
VQARSKPAVRVLVKKNQNNIMPMGSIKNIMLMRTHKNTMFQQRKRRREKAGNKNQASSSITMKEEE